MSRKKKRRTNSLRHVVVGGLGSPGGGLDLDCDCPICAWVAAQDEEILTLDPTTLALVPASRGPRPPVTKVTLAADPMIAPFLRGWLRELDAPRGMRVGDFIFVLCFLVPRLGSAFPAGGLELRADGRPLDPQAPVPAGTVTLVATAAPRRALA